MGISSLIGSSSGRLMKRPSLRSLSSSVAPPSPPDHQQHDDACSHPLGRSGSRSRSHSHSNHHITDADDLPPLDPDPPDLRELNNCLDALAAIFPDVQVEVFREMLASFDGESRLALAADSLLKNRAHWVKGRWRVPDKDTREKDKDNNEERGVLVPRKETFRTPGYKKAARDLLCREFKGLSKSTIDAVLAEYNYSYMDARPTLAQLATKSWRATISSLFTRRKPETGINLAKHPLVVWKSPAVQGAPAIPALKSSGNAELDRELYYALIHPHLEKIRSETEAADRALAAELNAAEAAAADNLVECACCFAERPFEEFTACTAQGHTLCFECVGATLKEAVFGQGWAANVLPETGSLKCFAEADCMGRITAEQMHRAMMGHENGATILHQLEVRLAKHNLLESNLPLIHCPFCEYVEVDDVYVPGVHDRPRQQQQQQQQRPQQQQSLPVLRQTLTHSTTLLRLLPALLLLFLLLTLFSFPRSLFLSLLLTVAHPVVFRIAYLAFFSTNTPFSAQFQYLFLLWQRIESELAAALQRVRRRRRGLRFQCLNPACRRASCLACHKVWIDVHMCHESAITALRTQIEMAMSLAVKRVCPRCNTAFVKEHGCNKLTCPCGYVMCYVCRKDISPSSSADDNNDEGEGREVGYRHFCPHFRPEGDGRKCSQCDKCNLWEQEDQDKVLGRAREEATRRWVEQARREGVSEEEVERLLRESGIGEGGLGVGVAVMQKSTTTEIQRMRARRKGLTLGDVAEWIAEWWVDYE